MDKEQILKLCDNCRKEYPAEILYSGMCGICALEILNRSHGLRRTKFDSDSGEYFRLEAIKWRKDHGR